MDVWRKITCMFPTSRRLAYAPLRLLCMFSGPDPMHSTNRHAMTMATPIFFRMEFFQGACTAKACWKMRVENAFAMRVPIRDLCVF